jgi:uncharacterized protein (TIGR02145 family)
MKKYIYLFLGLVFGSCSTEEPIPTYTLAVSVSPVDAGKITMTPQSANYKEGEMVTLTAEPNKNWVFKQWEGDESGNSRALEITMNSNKTVIGVFSAIVPTIVVDVRNPKTGKTWMDRNLGANRAATSSTDAGSYGHLYQWGRGTDGHQIRIGPKTTKLSTTDQPENGMFIIAAGINGDIGTDWRSPRNDKLWQGVNGVNNPCPIGYRLPTDKEWDAEIASWTTRDAAGAFASPLKLPMAGFRSHKDGSLNTVGTHGNYSSSTVSSSNQRSLAFTVSNAKLDYTRRGHGFSVRCIKN